MIEINLHNIAALLFVALVAAFGWSVGAWAHGKLGETGKIVALCVILLLGVVLYFGRL